jgi:hypothetical protein
MLEVRLWHETDMARMVAEIAQAHSPAPAQVQAWLRDWDPSALDTRALLIFPPVLKTLSCH